MALPYYVHLPQFIDSRGLLVACDGEHDIYFPIRRAFWIKHVPRGEIRGGGSHKKCHQLFVALSGFLDVECEEETYRLDSPFIALIAPPGNRICLRNFSEKCILLVLCSHHHDPLDYDRSVLCNTKRRERISIQK